MDEPREYAIGAGARLARVSVRTLHHYEEIGLLVPSRRTTTGSANSIASSVNRSASP